MKNYLTDLRLGDLLVSAGLVTSKQIAEAVQMSGHSKMHLGQALVRCGFLTHEQLLSTIAAQSMIKDKLIDPNTAIRTLSTCAEFNITFDEAARSLGLMEGGAGNRLGQLLVEAGAIEDYQVDAAIETSKTTGFPVGKVLVLHGAIAEPMLNMVLDVQGLIRDNAMSRARGIGLLRNCAVQSSEAEAVEFIQAQRNHLIRLGDLLVNAGILMRRDVTQALEQSLQEKAPIGQLLVRQGFTSQETIDNALNLQQMVDNKFLRPEQASRCLSYIDATGAKVSDALVHLGLVRVARPRVSRERLIGNHESAVTNPDATFGMVGKIGSTRVELKPGRAIRLAEKARTENPEFKNFRAGAIQAYDKLARAHFQRGDYSEAEWLCQRLVALREEQCGLHDLLLVNDLTNLSGVLFARSQFVEAERAMIRAIDIMQTSGEADGVRLADCLESLAVIYSAMGLYDDAEPLIQRALALKEMVLSSSHPSVAKTMTLYAGLLRRMNRDLEACKTIMHANAILEKKTQQENTATVTHLKLELERASA